MIDLIIIGGGPGGYEMAIKAKEENLSVCLIEKNKLGGTCLNWGCIPTKCYYKNAQVYKHVLAASEYGINLENPKLDFTLIKKRKDEVVASLTKGIEYALNKANVNLIYGEAKLIDQHHVEVNGEVIEAKNIVIAIGSKSKDLNIEGSSLMIDSKQLLDLDYLPRHLIIVGGGVIGVEFASIFANLNVKVTIIEYFENILPSFDEEVAKKMKLILKKQGIEVLNNAKVIKVIANGELTDVYIDVKGKESIITGDVVLKAVGRSGALDALNLEAINLETERGFIKVDENYQTNLDNIYAIGDCNGKSLLAHSATYQGYYVINQILNKDSNINFSIIPSAVFSFPPIASVGLTEKEAKDKNLNYHVNKFFYRANGKANAENETEGFIKMLIDENNLIIGCHILGEASDNIIHEVVILMNNNIKVEDAKAYIHAHPTLSEIISSIIHTF